MSNDNQAGRTCDDLIISIKKVLAMVENRSNWKVSIYKVPHKLLKLKEGAYTPRIVSIGPFHHNKAMQAFDEHKLRYMADLFKRVYPVAESTMHDCVTAILNLEKATRRCYSEETGLDKHKLAEILLIDGCFLLELFLKYSNIENHREDPLINNAQTIATLQHDLALLENQIPFFVLETLFDKINYHVPQPSRSSFTEHNVATLALHFFKLALGLSNQAIQSEFSRLSGVHLLDVLHNFYFPTIVRSPETSSDQIPQSRDLQRSGLRDCATKLSKAGICFAPNTADANRNLLGIKFPATGTVATITMPPLHIKEAITETIFRNLIAFEQCGGIGSTSHHIASYVFLMRSLLHSSDDVRTLHEERIITNVLSDGGGGEDVTSLFESICDGVVLNDFCFSKLCEDVNGYYYNSRSWWHWRRLYLILDDRWRTTKQKWHGYMSDLFSVYLKNPWTILKVLAAVLLLILTAWQTGYTIGSYHK